MDSNQPPLVVDEQDGHVLSVKLNRESKKNAITLAMYERLVGLLSEAESNDSVHVLLLSGGTTIFSAGNDIHDFMVSPPVQGNEPVWRFISALGQFRKPIVAAVNGSAIGIGATLLLHCDLVYAASDSKFSMPFVNLGLSPEAGSSLLLQQTAGPRAATEALLLGSQLSAERAKEMGLVTALLEPSGVLGHARAQAKAIASKPLSAVVATKRLLKAVDAKRLSQQIEDEIKAFGDLVVQDAAKRAFAEFAAP